MDDLLRPTPQRRAIIDVLAESPDHPTAQQVTERVRERMPEIGPATVYRTLAALVDSGAVAELRLPNGRTTRYDRTAHRHDHLVCLECGSVEDITIPIETKLIQFLKRETSFTPTHYEVTIEGVCASCAKSANPHQEAHT